MTTPLPRATAADVAIDPTAILEFIEALETTADVEPHSLMLIRHGAVVAEGWWRPYSADRVHLLYSLSKSFTSTALGLAVTEGLIALDDTVLSYFPELDAEVTDPRSRSILVRHVASMASGHRADVIALADARDPRDMVRGFLLTPPDEEPGSVFAYNQPCTFAVAAIIARVSGGSLTDYLRPRLFEPLGITGTGWIRDASGREIGYSGLHATTEAIARLGLLYLQKGRWGDRQLLPESWVEEATRSHVSSAAEGNPDWRQGYGFQFWMARHGYRGDGAYGQYCIVLPEHDTVIAMTGQTVNMQAALELVWAHLLPALDGTAPAGTATVDDVAARLSTLGLPPAAGLTTPDTRPQSFVAAAGNDQSSLTEIALTPGENGSWTVGLVEDGTRLEAQLGIGDWLISDVLAVSGGWNSSGTEVRIDVVFLETPHRLHLICTPAAGTFMAHWASVPLHPLPLRQLRRPGPEVNAAEFGLAWEPDPS